MARLRVKESAEVSHAIDDLHSRPAWHVSGDPILQAQMLIFKIGTFKGKIVFFNFRLNPARFSARLNVVSSMGRLNNDADIVGKSSYDAQTCILNLDLELDK